MNSGIPYFPLDVHLDDKFELIEAEFGLTGFAVVVKLLQKIYGGQGYYCEWTNDVALLFGKNLGLSGGNVVSEIVRAAIARGIFDETLYNKYQILTSEGIQKRYLSAVSRRASVEVKEQYLLVEVDQKYKNVNILAENVYKNKKNVYKIKQSKEKESKEEKSKGNSIRAEAEQIGSDVPIPTIVPTWLTECYQNNISHHFVTPLEHDNLEFWCERVEPDVIKYAISEAVNHNAANWSYIKRILENHYNAGRTTLDAVKNAKPRRGKDAGMCESSNGMTYDDIEKLIREKM